MIRVTMLSAIVLSAAAATGSQSSAQCCRSDTGASGVAFGAVADDHKQAKESLTTAYPLDTCPISGKKLGSMGEPVVKSYDDREVRFCCANCVKAFEADKAAQWKKIDEQIVKQQQPYYPTDTCVVSGDKFGGEMGEPVNYVWRNRLIRLCCSGCIKDWQADPKKYLTKLDEAIVKQQREKYPLKACLVSGEQLGSMGEPVEVILANRLVRLCCDGCLPDLKNEPAKHLAKLDEVWKAAGGSPIPPTEKDTGHDHSNGDHDHP